MSFCFSLIFFSKDNFFKITKYVVHIIAVKFTQKDQGETFSIDSHDIQFIWFLAIHTQKCFFPHIAHFNLNTMFFIKFT